MLAQLEGKVHTDVPAKEGNSKYT